MRLTTARYRHGRARQSAQIVRKWNSSLDATRRSTCGSHPGDSARSSLERSWLLVFRAHVAGGPTWKSSRCPWRARARRLFSRSTRATRQAPRCRSMSQTARSSRRRALASDTDAVVGTTAKMPGRSSWTSLSVIAGSLMETATRSRSFAQMDSDACTANAGRWTIAGRLMRIRYLVSFRCSNFDQGNEDRSNSSPRDAARRGSVRCARSCAHLQVAAAVRR